MTTGFAVVTRLPEAATCVRFESGKNWYSGQSSLTICSDVANGLVGDIIGLSIPPFPLLLCNPVAV